MDRLRQVHLAAAALGFAALACEGATRATVTGTQQQSITKGELSLGPTFRVKDMWIIAGSDRRMFTEFQGDLILFGDSGPRGSAVRGVWRTDGTPGGNRLLRGALVFGWPGDSRNAFQDLNGVLYFSARDFSARDPSRIDDYELWRTDGTPAGTYLLKDIHVGAGGSSPQELTRVGDYLYFTAWDGTAEGLWRTDGTPGGTTQVLELSRTPAAPASNRPLRELTHVNGKLYFTRTSSDGAALWKLEPCADSRYICDASPVLEAVPDRPRLLPHHLEAVGDELSFFASWSDATGHSHAGLWWTDGTATGTRLVREFEALPRVPGTHYSIAMNGTLYFVASNSSWTGQLWKSDGTPGGTALVKEVAIAWGQEMASIAGGRLAFFGGALDEMAGITDCEPWTSDGTSDGTARIKDINRGSGDSCVSPDRFPPLALDPEGLLFFTATDGVNGAELWRSDGTTEGTRMVQDLAPGAAEAYPMAVARAGDLLYFAMSVDDAPELWAVRTDLADGAPPDVTCPPDVVVEASSDAGAVVDYPAATAMDNMTASPATAYDVPSGSALPLGITTVRASATDDAGNAASCTFHVTVQDTTPPALTCPADVVAEATSAQGAAVAFPPATTTDAVSSPELAYDAAPGAIFPPGTARVNVTATDAAGNASRCSFSVEVRDTTAPLVECPGPIEAEATSAEGAEVEIPAPRALDAVSSVSVILAPAGARFPLGETIVTATARDAAGNIAACQIPVRVRDTTAPTLVCPADVRVETAGDGAAVTLEAPSASDAVTAQPTVALDAQSGLFGVGSTQVHVAATDAAGNVASCTFQVIVEYVAPVLPPSMSIPTASSTSAEASAPRAGCSQGGSGAAGLAALVALGLRRRRRAASC